MPAPSCSRRRLQGGMANETRWKHRSVVFSLLLMLFVVFFHRQTRDVSSFLVLDVPLSAEAVLYSTTWQLIPTRICLRTRGMPTFFFPGRIAYLVRMFATHGHRDAGAYQKHRIHGRQPAAAFAKFVGQCGEPMQSPDRRPRPNHISQFVIIKCH